MLGRQKQSIEALLRARQCIGTSGVAEASPQVAGVVRQFEEVVDRCQRAAVHQVYGTRTGQACTQELRVAVRRLRERHLRPLATIAQAVDGEVVGLSSALRMPRRRLPVTLLLAATAGIRTVAERNAELFRRYGRSDAFLSELDAAVAEVQACVSRRNRAELLQVGATKAITVHLARARGLVDVLDTIVAARFEDDDAKLAEWRQAKRVQLKPGPKRPQGETSQTLAEVLAISTVMELAPAAPTLELVVA